MPDSTPTQRVREMMPAMSVRNVAAGISSIGAVVVVLTGWLTGWAGDAWQWASEHVVLTETSDCLVQVARLEERVAGLERQAAADKQVVEACRRTLEVP